MLTIRMARRGRTHRPIYSIVVADTRSPRDGRFLATLGQYDPKAAPNLIDVQVEELKKWHSQGAQLTDTVRTLLKSNKIQYK